MRARLHKIKMAIKKGMPKPVWNSFRYLKNFPRKLTMGPPVVQVYLNDGDTRSFLGLNNFYSVLLSQIPTEAHVEIEFYDADGNSLFREEQLLAHFAARSFDVQRAFRERGITSSHGIVTTQIVPLRPRRSVYKELGLVKSEFFMFYVGKHGSLGDIHPLSVVDANPAPTDAWNSKQFIFTQGLAGVSVIQCNPSRKYHVMEHRVLDVATEMLVAAKRCELPPMSTRKVTFAVSHGSGSPTMLRLALDSLPTSNSKPMLMREFESEKFSMSHS